MSLKRKTGTFALLAALTLFGAGCTSDSDDSATVDDTPANAESDSGDDTTSEEATTDEGVDVNEATDEEAPDELAAEGNDNVPEPADLSGVEQMWVDNGTSPELASCYRGVLEGAGIEEVADLNELTEIMAGLDADGQQAINDCIAS